ncbi:MAG: methylenetetrahydrofolate reductase [Deltaproteobacteria bacterium]|nr:methylenetetrahydrofolate reductase [Deltaproteobacteria bacterium]
MTTYSAGSNLEKIFKSGKKAVTGECGPPRGADAEHFRYKANFLKGCVDAVNVTDNQTAVVRFCSLAASKILLEMGIEPVMQMVTRDMNRIALQSNILGAAAMGIKNLLCLTGDHQSFGDHPQSKNVHDLDSVQLANTLRMMRDEGKMISGTEVQGRPQMFIGAAANPFADPQEFRVVRMGKKIAAGVQFIQTQCIYNMERFHKFMEMANDMGLTEKAYIMAGITPLKSVGMANYMKKFVPGLDVPDSYITRLKGVPKDKQAAEGIKIAVEQIHECLAMKGIAGIHLMAIEWEERVPEILETAGLLPRPTVS